MTHLLMCAFLDLNFSTCICQFPIHYNVHVYVMDFVVHISHHNYNLLSKLFSQRTPSSIMNVKFSLLVYTYLL